MGTVVLKQGKSVVSGVEVVATYLLDGRQRKETFERMINPEEVYRWTAVTLRLRPKTTQEEVVSKFNDYVNDYFFGLEDWESEPSSEDTRNAAPPDEVSLEEAAAVNDDEVQVSEVLDVLPSDEAASSFELLQQVVLAVHPVRKKGRSSRLRDPFAFSNLITPDYVVKDDLGNTYVDIDALMSWLRIQRERERAKGEDVFPPTEDTFLGWLLPYVADEATAKKVEQLLGDRWPLIEHSLLLFRALELKVRQSSVGLVEIREKATPEDEKKIFEIINTAGAKLTAAEILSATPAWDVAVPGAPESVQADARSLYHELKVEFSEPIRRWDVAATLLDRIVPASPLVFGDAKAWAWHGIKAKQFERKVTLGFKILSGYYQQKLMKSHVASLPADASVAWDGLSLEDAMTKSQAKLKEHWFFTYLAAWGFSFAASLSDAVALDFLLECTMDWNRKGAPMVAGHQLSSFRKNAIQLFDRVLLEYLTDVWRGSSDSRVARNLDRLMSRAAGAVVQPVAESDWSALIDQVMEGELGGRSYLGRQDPRMRLLLTYASVIMKLRPDDALAGSQVDHIIPQKLFKQESDATLSNLKHHIGNLELLPDKINTFKSDERLKDLSITNVVDGVEKFSRVRRESFPTYSNVAAVPQLIELRGAMLRQVLTIDRTRLLADPDEFSEPHYWIEP
jgi:hypothetical protein